MAFVQKELSKVVYSDTKESFFISGTVARNMSYCDEFIIVTDYEYRYIIQSQMYAFQGVTYRSVYEEEGKGAGPAIVLTWICNIPSWCS